MSSLADREKKHLLEIARRAVVAAVEQRQPVEAPDHPAESEPGLLRHGGAFVTLLLRGRLRGCIGQMDSDAPLKDVVAHCARVVAREDPRFQPLRPEELPSIEIELSVLSDPEDVRPGAIQVGTHGLLVTSGEHRGLLLPQVATQFRWDALRLLEETCEKAGLPRDAWKSPHTRMQAFTAEVFSEKNLASP
jgi:AmmeMemoRadiSam system protein A